MEMHLIYNFIVPDLFKSLHEILLAAECKQS